jgi:HSP20 family molecular chaperone IbpA
MNNYTTSLFNELINPVNQIQTPTEDFGRVHEHEDSYTVMFPLPGFSKEDVDICAEQESVQIKAKRGQREQNYRIRLNNKVSIPDIEASIEHGLLHVRMPKKASEKRVTITVK